MVCPLTLEVFHDPVQAPDGHTYERSAIERWVREGKNTSPKTGTQFEAKPSFIPNHTVRGMIDEMIERDFPDRKKEVDTTDAKKAAKKRSLSTNKAKAPVEARASKRRR
jgi:hypothetical protein